MRGKEGFYSQRPTLAELYEVDPDLFEDMVLPEELDAGVLQVMILDQFGELDTIAHTTTALRRFLAAWSSARVAAWSRQLQALNSEYNPIHNYDRTETETEAAHSRGGSTFSGSTKQTGSDTQTNAIQGYNSTSYEPSEQVTRVPDLTNNSNSATQSTGAEDRSRTLHAAGNIGVTTSQQMITAELEMRDRWTVYGVVLEAFRRDICVGVW